MTLAGADGDFAARVRELATEVSRQHLHELGLQLGVDLSDPDDVRKVREKLDWIDEHRKRLGERRSQRMKVFWALVVSFITAVATKAAEILSSVKIGSGP